MLFKFECSVENSSEKSIKSLNIEEIYRTATGVHEDNSLNDLVNRDQQKVSITSIIGEDLLYSGMEYVCRCSF